MHLRKLLPTLTACLAAVAAQAEEQRRPGFIRGAIQHQTYDGVADDLLTGGLGASGLALASPPPGFADQLKPTAAELRRRALYQNYRALVDVAPNGGYGTLYGPTVGRGGKPLPNDGRIAGDEYLAYADDGSGRENVTMMVQVPESFDPRKPCIVTAPSSGSRGVYGAIGTAGEWGLKRGCAVAYTDKGSGNGAHDLQNNTVNLIDGTRAKADGAVDSANFIAYVSPQALADFNAATPNRFAFKHAHSQQNPEGEWGEDVLDAVRFAFFLLNEKFGEKEPGGRAVIRRSNTIVIASAVSNGGGASLAAAARDRDGWIDGVAVSEPQVQLDPHWRLRIFRGGNEIRDFGKSLYDYSTIANLYQPCAALTAANAASPGLAFITSLNRAANRCASLHAKGLLKANTLAAQADEALAKLHEAGWEPDSDLLHASHFAFAVPQIGPTYANTYGRFSVLENLCGFSFGATDATTFVPIPATAANVAKIFADGNGIPPTGGISLINNLSEGGPKLDGVSISPSTKLADFNIDGALCLRKLATGRDPSSGSLLLGAELIDAIRVLNGIQQTLNDTDLGGKPAIIVHGRADMLVPVNHTSRPFYGTNKLREFGRSKLQYYEITNAQHFDGFIDNPALPGYDSRFVPLNYYFIQALDLMYEHLTNRAPLPLSQVVRPKPRGGTPGSAPAITAANLPPISRTPASGNLVRFSGGTLQIPE
jgi:hydroxybutyrate-dimer hydrolase